jgi:hypothetical protein
MPRLASIAARSTMREKPAADSGGPRSETNTREIANSPVDAGAVRAFPAGQRMCCSVPFLTCRTCRVAVLKSTCSQRRSAISAARRPCAHQRNFTQNTAP